MYKEQFKNKTVFLSAADHVLPTLGKNIPDGKKSIAIKVIIQPNLETLTDDDLEKISSDLINVIDTKLSGSLRSQ